ncbi:MAG: hypothetical protein AB8G99_23020, partial [Planctomycetaceae bacterium]
SAMYFGGAASITFALLVAFIFMVTAVSYQLRGWLGRMMENKRTRGTVITVTTIFFVLVMQLPQFITMKSIGSGSNERREIRKSYDDDIAALQEQVAANELSANEYTELATTRQETFKAERQAFFDANAAASHRFTRKINTFVPPGWLALGATDAAAGKIGIPLLCVFGMAAIGTVSLALSYRSTLRVYTGTHNKDFRETVASKKTSATEGTPLDRELPLLTGQQSTMTLASFRSMLRAPEAKMALLTPLIMMVVFGSLMLTGKMNRFPAVGRPMVGVGAIGMALLGMIQILLNMFGLDRQGFRAYVLMPIPRRDVLLGKNLGVFPIGAALTIPLIVFSAVVFGMQPTHLLATLLQIPIVYFIFFTVTNYISIAAPIGIASGSMKPTTMNFKVVMMQLLGTLLMPAAFIPAILALGTEILAVEFGTLGTWPWFLIITIVELPIALLYYRMMLNLLGRYLSEREQAILEVISQVKD